METYWKYIDNLILRRETIKLMNELNYIEDTKEQCWDILKNKKKIESYFNSKFNF